MSVWERDREDGARVRVRESESLYLSWPWSPGPHIIYGPNHTLNCSSSENNILCAPTVFSDSSYRCSSPNLYLKVYTLLFPYSSWESLNIPCPRMCVCVIRSTSPSHPSKCVCVRACNQGPLLRLIPFQHTDHSRPDGWPTGVDSLLPIPSCTLAGTHTNMLLPATRREDEWNTHALGSKCLGRFGEKGEGRTRRTQWEAWGADGQA